MATPVKVGAGAVRQSVCQGALVGIGPAKPHERVVGIRVIEMLRQQVVIVCFEAITRAQVVTTLAPMTSARLGNTVPKLAMAKALPVMCVFSLYRTLSRIGGLGIQRNR